MERPQVVLVVRGIIRQGNEILLLQRSLADRRIPGLWELPGGKIDQEQLVTEGGAREILEETGLTVELRRPILFQDQILGPESKYPNHLYLVLFCECWLKDDHPTTTLSSEHEQSGWFTISQIRRKKLTPGTRQAITTFLGMR